VQGVLIASREGLRVDPIYSRGDCLTDRKIELYRFAMQS
jgi:hypothetical protein